jgi:hypothetical protein
MSWNPFKKKPKEPELDPLKDLTLSNLKPGYFLEYDLKTWQVKGQNRYDFDGDRTDEWELVSGEEVRYLEREEDDGVTWTLTQKIPVSQIEGNLQASLRNQEDPPERVTCDGVEYFGESSQVGTFFKDGTGTGQEFIVWDYIDRSQKLTLGIEQWGDEEYEASLGEIVEEYQFSRIIPSKQN